MARKNLLRFTELFLRASSLKKKPSLVWFDQVEVALEELNRKLISHLPSGTKDKSIIRQFNKIY